MSDDPGVMGNLPRARPGRRSAKRASEVKPPGGDTGASEAGTKAASGGAKSGGAKATASRAKSSGKKAPASRAKSGGAKSTGAKARGAQSRSKSAGAKSGASARAKPRTTRARSGGPAATTPSADLGTAARETAPRTAVREERTETQQGQDPITSALRLGMAVGDAGLKAVAKIAQRLPRP